MDADNGCRWTDQPGDWDPCTPQQTPLTNRIELSQFLASGTSTHKTLKFARNNLPLQAMLAPAGFPSISYYSQQVFPARCCDCQRLEQAKQGHLWMLLRIFLSLSLFGFLTCVLNNELCDLVKERVELGSNQPSTASSTCRTKWRLCTRNLC